MSTERISTISIEVSGFCKKVAVVINDTVDASTWADDLAQFAAANRDSLTGLTLPGVIPGDCGFPALADGLAVISARSVMHTTDNDGNQVIKAEVTLLATVPR